MLDWLADSMTFDYNFDEDHSKGFSCPEKWERFARAVHAGDTFEVHNAILQSGSERKFVDPLIFNQPTKDQDLVQESIDKSLENGSGIYSDKYKAQDDFVYELSQLRDAPLDSESLKTLPNWLREVSYFLRDEVVDKYKPGVDFMKDEENFNHVQRGGVPKEKLEITGKTKIETLRDCASYVHKDHYLIPFVKAADELIKLQAPHRASVGIVESRDSISQHFSCWGAPFIGSLLGETLNRACVVSFMLKYAFLIARPEWSYYRNNNIYLPQAYPEGSPMHASEFAMHSMVGKSQTYLLREIFQKDFTLPNGNTVDYELELLGDNVGGWRLPAGVHRLEDHIGADSICKEIALRVLKENGCDF